MKLYILQHTITVCFYPVLHLSELLSLFYILEDIKVNATRRQALFATTGFFIDHEFTVKILRLYYLLYRA